MKILVTGSSGLIGGEVVRYFGKQGHKVVGIDNNMRQEFFGPAGSTLGNCTALLEELFGQFIYWHCDIRSRDVLEIIFKTEGPFDVVIHCAAQPSHDKAKEIPYTDFEVNAVGTLNLLEMLRQHSPDGVFIFMSTNKVYGDAPNELPFFECPSRYDYIFHHAIGEAWPGFDENTRVDASTHSIFGVSKAAADLMVQEYGRYFGLKTVCLRGGCLTGPTHAGVELHGFLSYLVKATKQHIPYKIYGYKGKQVRDNIHSVDVARAMELIINNPPTPGSVFNIGGGRENSISMLEAIERVFHLSGVRLNYEYIETPRVGDHVCYITDMAKFKRQYPSWHLTRSLTAIFQELIFGV